MYSCTGFAVTDTIMSFYKRIKYDTSIFLICNSLFNKIPSMYTVYNMMTILI